MENKNKDNKDLEVRGIPTQAVFSEGNTVFLKKNNVISLETGMEDEEWFPVNFQWIPVMELRKNLLQQSNS
ncbi:hypothetical protein WIW50_01675 [Flavobacteriaceae bacterium 3-367]|uniref:hypothetical protein n=1 Tax=Eudoraea algarum TaxID=3417568 RepID=UPI00328F456F